MHLELILLPLALASMPLVAVLHEAGHAVVALAVGFRVVEMSVGGGPPLLHRRWRGTEVTMGRSLLWGGWTVVSRDSIQGWRWRSAAVCLSGPAANLIGVGTICLLPRVENTLAGALLGGFALANVVGVGNLLPFTTRREGWPSDGLRLWRLLRMDRRKSRSMVVANLGVELAAHVAAGRRADAVARARAILSLEPGDPLANWCAMHEAQAAERWADMRTHSACVLAGTERPPRPPAAPAEQAALRQRHANALYCLNVFAWATLRASGSIHEAVEAAELALAWNPDDLPVLDTCGEALVRSGRPAEGREMLLRAWAGLTASDQPALRASAAYTARSLALAAAELGDKEGELAWITRADAMRHAATPGAAVG